MRRVGRGVAPAADPAQIAVGPRAPDDGPPSQGPVLQPPAGRNIDLWPPFTIPDKAVRT
jgi:hypothetical protein